MRPVKLEFSGINSFSEHTIIDFERLTSSGLFGIFGDTGSGKSTILDAINFALYGNVERSKEKTDVINYHCAQAEVKFTFDILDCGARKTYTVERVLKKDKYGTHKAMLYEKVGEKETCIADKTTTVERKVVDILGVEAEDFRKCIALPQGEFSQFVKSAPRERLVLIERLFSLSVYGDRLREKLNARQTEAEAEYQNISGRLQGYEEVTEDALNAAYMRVNEETDRLKTLESKASSLAVKCGELKSLNEKKRELCEVEKSISAMLSEREEKERLRSSLSVLPACREAVLLDDEITFKLRHIAGVTSQMDDLQRKISSEDESVFALEKALKEEDFEGKIAECVRLDALYKTSGDKTEKLDKLNAQLSLKRAEYVKSQKESDKLSAQVQQAEREMSAAEKSLKSLGVKDIGSLLGAEFKGAVLKEEYIASLDYFATLNGNVKVYKDDTPLYGYISAELEGKIKEYAGRISDVKDFSAASVEGRLSEIQLYEKEKEERTARYNECTARLQKLRSDYEIGKNLLSSVKKEGEELKSRADEIKEEIIKIFGKESADFSAAEKENSDKLLELKTRREKLQTMLEEGKNRKHGLVTEIEKLKTSEQSAKAELSSLKEKCGEILKRTGIDSLSGCRKLYSEFENIPDAEKVLLEYDAKFAALNLRKRELTEIAGIDNVSDEAYAAAEAERAEMSEEVTKLSGEVAVLKKECEKIKKGLDEKAEILKLFTAAEKKRDLLARLKEVTKNNKFLEYIANEYLCDISALASTTLLKLKDGRYFLTYKDNNFYVGDNFDGGNLRGVNTLSGGEIFLVSLSLALALSQTICARSMKSIEFFFLDEGFGTLDTTLTETVMNALEKLKSADFTIGVISHVEELKHRIDSKITVNKATESHGSTVSISC